MAPPDDDRGPGLAWPDHDTGPTPPPSGRERGEEVTRKPLAPWDRVKFLVLLAVLWLAFLWALKSDNPIIPWGDAVRENLRAKWWLLALAVAESVRQLHYAISEQSAAYHRFWSQRVFGSVERRSTGWNDWTRYRVGRAVRVAAAVVLLGIVLGALYDESPVVALFELPRRVWDASPLLLQIAFGFFFGIIQFIGIFWFLSRGGVDVYYPDDIKTRFSDVWGQDAVLERVKENILFLENPEAIEEKGGYVPGGILLWGPPGTGKTLMAEAVAGETGKPYVFVDPGAFINMFLGVGILKVKALFRRLRKLALRYGGVIVFFDEADSLGNRGALAPGNWGGAMSGLSGSMLAHTPPCNGWSYLDQRTASFLFHQSLAHTAGADPVPPRRDRVIVGGWGGGGMGTLQALLTELSGLKKPRGFVNRVIRRALGMRPKPPPKYRILVMMATNMPQALDEALLRPGRIDRIYKVGYPSKAGRIRTYEGYLAKVRHELTPADIDKLATITPYATGATIKDLVNEALIVAIRDGRDTITWADIVRAKQLKDLGPPEDVEYIERERHAVAIHEACHAVVAYRVRQHLTIDIATIEKGGTYLGLVASIPPEDQFTRWRTEYEADIMVSLASLAGERMFFDGDNSSGVAGDLESATQIATLMEGYWGMGRTLAVHGVTQKVGIVGGGKPGDEGKKKDRDLLASSLGARIEAKLEELLRRTEELLAANRREVLAVAHALETHKTVTGDDIEAIIEGRQGPLIDGRPYLDPAFLEAAEAYHAQVVAAHKAHRRVEVPLPELNGHREPVGVLAGTDPEPRDAGTDPEPRDAGTAEAPDVVDLEPGEVPRRARPLRARRPPDG
jgi:cell division protease FtsH